MARPDAALLALLLLTAASAPVGQEGISLDDQLKQSRSEETAAEAETARLETAAGKARNEVDRLRVQEAAAAAALEAAEARISAADARLRIASSYVAAHRRRLAEQQQPITSLLTGIATMSRRPPLLAIADDRSVDELVRVRILLDSTVPVIRARTGKLAAELGEAQRLEQNAASARAELARGREDLGGKRRQFAILEQRALQIAAMASGQALSAGDVELVASEHVEQLTGAEPGSRSALTMASQLAALDSAPSRPGPVDTARRPPPFDYQLPATAGVTEGLEEVNASGVRSRGLTLATLRGASVVAPAAGVVKFAGPYGKYDGVLIIDHGGGWMSLIVNVSSELGTGERVEPGQAIGRALGPLQVELSQYGRRISPALIAGSSQSLSNNSKGG
jgi:septal ring factor EnvC (AmiA/AmiB activator)